MNKHQLFPTDIVIKQTLFQVQNDGEYVKSVAPHPTVNTPSLVERFLKTEAKSDFSGIQYSDSINTQYTAIVEYVDRLYKDALAEGSFDQGYVTPIRNCIHTNNTDSRMVGKVASIVNLYNKNQYFKKFAYTESPIGVVGERDDFFVKLIDRRAINEKDVFKVVTRDGGLGSFWALPDVSAESGKPGLLDIGDCVVIRATPKKYEHNKYDKMKMTTFGGRIQVKENVGQTREERHS